MRDHRPTALWFALLAIAGAMVVVSTARRTPLTATGAAAPPPRHSNQRGEGAASPTHPGSRQAPAEPDAKTLWRELAGQPPSIARDAELADRLEQLAEADPDDAAGLLLALTEDDRRRVVAAVLLDAARVPDHAATLADQFCRADPGGAMDHGYSLVATLTRADEFDAALRFVDLQAAAGESENPSKWLRGVFAAWAERAPEAARAAATALPGEGLREEALLALADTGARMAQAAP